MSKFMTNFVQYAKRVFSEEVLSTAGKGLIAAGNSLIEMATYVHKLRVLMGVMEEAAKIPSAHNTSNRFPTSGCGSRPQPSTQDPLENGPRA